MELKAIIIDDEPKAGKLLQLMVEEVDTEISILHRYPTPEQALVSIGELDIDMIFLDIQMPQMNGFEFLKRLDDRDLMVVFVTGYDKYAIQALKIAAVGYILKPIDIDDLRISLTKVKVQYLQKVNMYRNSILLENLSKKGEAHTKIGIPSHMGIDFIKLEDVICCIGTDKYTEVLIENQSKILSSYSVGEFQKLLEGHRFFQVHRSYIVNLSKVKQYQKDGSLILDNGMAVPVARRRKEEFLALMLTVNR